jgi:hypothetical protein
LDRTSPQKSPDFARNPHGIRLAHPVPTGSQIVISNMTTIRPVTLIRTLAAAALVAGLGGYSAVRLIAQGSISITQCPSSPCVLKAGPDFATDTFADPWDFSNREDVAIDPMQITGFSSFSIGNVVAGRAIDSSANFAMLERPWAGIINPGKTGGKFPVNPAQYTKLSVKFAAGVGGRIPRVYWFNSDVGAAGGSGWQYFDSVDTTPDIDTTPAGNGIYVIDLTKANPVDPSVNWFSGLVKGLAFYPNDQGSPFDFAFDWVRLTAADTNTSAAMMTIIWSGASGDITVTDAGATTYTIRKAVGSSGNVNWNYGVLPPGTYTLKVGSSAQKTFTINAPPLIHVTDPDETGGADFATDVLHNPWDMSDAADVEHGVNIVPHVFNEFWDGRYNATSDGVTVAWAGSVPVGDPQVYLLSNQKTSNTTDIIDSTKYHRLTFDLTIDRVPYNLAEGWVARVFWGSDSSDSAPGGTPYNVTTSKDIIMWPGKNTYTIDLATLTTTNGGLESYNATPWSQVPIRHFRIDPFEIAAQVPFHMDNVKLGADDETTANRFTIHWTGSDADPGDSPVVTLYYVPAGGSPTLIAGSIPLSAGQYQWNTSSVPPGTYSIYAVASDALNYTAQFSTGPVKVTTYTPASNPFIDLDTPHANQVVTSAFEVGGWALDAAATSGTGVDAIQFYVFPPGSPGVFIGQGKVGISRPDVASIFGQQFINSGFHYTITGMSPGNFVLGVYAHSTITNTYSIVKTVPFTVNGTSLMGIDVPRPEAEIAVSSFAVSGWAIDRSVESTALAGSGVDIIHVYAFRNPGSGEPGIYLGSAIMGTFRPDVAALYGQRYDHAGWDLVVDRNILGLTPGVYNIVPNAHSSVSGTFNNLAIIQVTLK